MTASFSTLSALDRCLVAAPVNCWSVETLVHDFGNVVDCVVEGFNGQVKLNAVRVSGDCFDVTVRKFPRLQGSCKLTKTIRFTTTETWVNAWVDKVQSQV
jgi:hypothetical protein